MREKIKELVQEIGISEIEKTLEELKSETTCCNKPRNWFYESAKNILKSRKCSCDNHQRARDWFNDVLKGVSIYKKEGYPESLFFKNGNDVVLMQQCFIRNILYVYNVIWSELRTYFDLNDNEIRYLIQNMINEHFKINVGKPLETIPTPHQMMGCT